MDVTRGEDGLTSVVLGDALATFADATGLSAAAPPELLAAAAGRAIRSATGIAQPVLFADQVHGALTYVYGSHGELAPEPHRVGRCDALITGEIGVTLTVRTADCLPVAIAGPRVVAIVHAGWRGLAADVLGAAVRRIAADFGVLSGLLRAVVGVGIGPCHYVVGEEVHRGLERLDVPADGWRRGKAVDLKQLAVGRLLALGVPADGIVALDGCTYCDGRHHSFRRDGQRSGRQWSAVTLCADA